MKAKVYILECLTNLHAGSGDANFNIIDNQVQRDVVTGFPTIHSSGVKGALRVFFEEKEERKELEQTKIDEMFGKEAKTNDSVTSQGLLKFLDATLLAQPIQNSQGGKPYQLKAPTTAIEDFKQALHLFLSDVEIDAQSVLDSFAITEMEDAAYREYDLPVMARNQLKNGTGESENLWYEEVVPHKTHFYLVVAANEKNKELLNEFDESVNGQIIQIGGNASIGYGLCMFKNIENILREN